MTDEIDKKLDFAWRLFAKACEGHEAATRITEMVMRQDHGDLSEKEVVAVQEQALEAENGTLRLLGEFALDYWREMEDAGAQELADALDVSTAPGGPVRSETYTQIKDAPFEVHVTLDGAVAGPIRKDVSRITVSGCGPFPIGMLCACQAFPESEFDAMLITKCGLASDNTVQDVRLIARTPYGEAWPTYGWELTRLNCTEAEEALREWDTCRLEDNNPKAKQPDSPVLVTVKGSGQFPIYFLRCCRGWPATDEDCLKIGGSMDHIEMPEYMVDVVVPQARWLSEERWQAAGWEVVQKEYRF